MTIMGDGCGASCPAREYVYSGGQLVAEYGNGTTYFMSGDHLGSTRMMTGVNQSIFDDMDYLPFGEQILGGTGTTHKFTGYPRDAETGLDYALFRHYSSRQGSFMQPDPYNAGADVTSPQSWNAYAYVGNNPLNRVDPTGMSGVDTTPGGCPAEYITCGSSVGQIFGGAAGGVGGSESSDCMLNMRKRCRNLNFAKQTSINRLCRCGDSTSGLR